MEDNIIIWICQLCHKAGSQVRWGRFSRPLCDECRDKLLQKKLDNADE